MDLQIGDIVQLKTGGARMNVETLPGDGRQVHCVWQAMVGSHWETRQDVFAADDLARVGSPQAPAADSVDVGPDYKVYEEGDD